VAGGQLDEHRRSGVVADLQTDRPRLRVEISPDERQVLLVDSAALERHGQGACRLRPFGDQEHAGGLAVQAVHEPQALPLLLAAQHADQAVLADAVDRVDRDPGRLVHREPAVAARQHRDAGIDDFLVHRRVAHAHHAPGDHRPAGTRRDTPGQRDALADRALDAHAGQARDALVQEAVESLAAVPLADLELGLRLTHGRSL
jgi:hypothetical protein